MSYFFLTILIMAIGQALMLLLSYLIAVRFGLMSNVFQSNKDNFEDKQFNYFETAGIAGFASMGIQIEINDGKRTFFGGENRISSPSSSSSGLVMNKGSSFFWGGFDINTLNTRRSTNSNKHTNFTKLELKAA